MEIKTVIFDLGGVLIDWNPRYVYRTIFKTEEEIDWFFENVATHDWNENQDEGRVNTPHQCYLPIPDLSV